MRKKAVTLIGALAFSTEANAQTFDVGLAASPKNMALCSSGDSTWAKKWKIQVTGDTATVSGGTPVTLKKTAESLYYSELNTGHTGTFFVTFNPTERSLKVVNKAYGCTWEGKL